MTKEPATMNDGFFLFILTVILLGALYLIFDKLSSFAFKTKWPEPYLTSKSA